MLAGLLLLVLSAVEARGPHHPTAPVDHHQHSHTRPSTDKKFLEDGNLLHDREHIKEHLGDWADDSNEPMSDEEVEFKYFKAHDFDSNTKLDGLEIFEAIRHAMESTHNDESPQSWSERENSITEIVDQVLGENDANNDGYISYAEYLISRRKQRDT